MTQEQWKTITEYQGHKFDGKFEVSSWGNVRQKETKKSQPFYTDRANGKGYLKFKLRDTDRKRVAIKVHRLVAYAFVGNGAENQEVDHIDGNSRNNSMSNLRWVTHRENCQSMHAGIKKAKEAPQETLETTCKYCGCTIAANLYCCRSCWKEMEEGDGADE